MVLGYSNLPASLPYMTPVLRCSPFVAPAAAGSYPVTAAAPTPGTAPSGAHPGCKLVAHTERRRQRSNMLRLLLHHWVNLQRRKAAWAGDDIAPRVFGLDQRPKWSPAPRQRAVAELFNDRFR